MRKVEEALKDERLREFYRKEKELEDQQDQKLRMSRQEKRERKEQWARN